MAKTPTHTGIHLVETPFTAAYRLAATFGLTHEVRDEIVRYLETELEVEMGGGDPDASDAQLTEYTEELARARLRVSVCSC